MRDLLSWNLSLGRWGGVQVRLHVFLLAWVVLLTFYCTLPQKDDPLWTAIASVAVLLFSLLWHELGHCLAARKVGGHTEQIVLWPLGGLSLPDVPPEPQAELTVALAGPVASLLLCIAALPLLLVLGEDALTLLNPLLPPGQLNGETALPLLLRLTFWLNWSLAMVNLLPAAPLDGGRLMRAVLWFGMGQHRSAAMIAARAGQATAIGLWAVAWLVHGTDSYQLVWMPLVMLGLYLFFYARQELDRAFDPQVEDSAFGYDFSQGYTSLERHFEAPKPRVGLLRQWIESRRRARLLRQRQVEEDDERRVDAILARVQETGIEGLSADDRALLERVSARYRNRLRG